MGVVCAPHDLTFVCVGYHSPWASECLNGWHITKQCLFSYLTVPLSLHKQTEITNWSTSLNLHHWIRTYQEAFMTQDLLPLAGPHFPYVNVLEAMIRNLSLTLKDAAESAAKAVVAQWKSLHALPKVDPDNRIALDYFWAEQGGICVAPNTTCCTWGLTLLGKLKLSYIRSLSKPIGLKRWLLQWSLSLTHLI